MPFFKTLRLFRKYVLIVIFESVFSILIFFLKSIDKCEIIAYNNKRERRVSSDRIYKIPLTRREQINCSLYFLIDT